MCANDGYLRMVLLQKLISRKNNSIPFRILLHVALWLFYWAISAYFNTISYNLFANTRLAWLDPLFGMVNLMLFYYPFIYLTWPLLFKKKKYLAGILLLLVQVIIYTIIFEVLERQLINYCSSCKELLTQLPAQFRQGLQQTLLAGVMSSLASVGILYILMAKLSPIIAIKIALDFSQERIAAAELEKENLLLEFNFLKSQVNPHFLFNTLNNIHSLVVQEKKQKASATIAKLSGFLRHSLYETGNESILLSRQTTLLEDYIELEKLRLNKTNVTLTVSSDDKTAQVPPLLFFPLVENAFKYTADNLPGDSFIQIDITLKNKNLLFSCRNNYDPMKRTNSGGIGLQNLVKRLRHHYAGTHNVRINDSSTVYEITISINL
jgi:hypothetical protein